MGYSLDVVRPDVKSVFERVPESKWKRRASEAARQFRDTGRYKHTFDDARGVTLVAHTDRDPTKWHYMIDGQVVKTYVIKNVKALDRDIVAEV